MTSSFLLRAQEKGTKEKGTLMSSLWVPEFTLMTHAPSTGLVPDPVD